VPEIACALPYLPPGDHPKDGCRTENQEDNQHGGFHP